MTLVTETFIPRGSSTIAAATYDPEAEQLTIEFQSGGVYVYSSVPPSVYRGLQASGSAGKYFHRQIKDVYAYEQV